MILYHTSNITDRNNVLIGIVALFMLHSCVISYNYFIV